MKIFLVRSYNEWYEIVAFKNRSNAIRYIKEHGCKVSEMKRYQWFIDKKSRDNDEEPEYVLEELEVRE